MVGTYVSPYDRDQHFSPLRPPNPLGGRFAPPHPPAPNPLGGYLGKPSSRWSSSLAPWRSSLCSSAPCKRFPAGGCSPISTWDEIRKSCLAHSLRSFSLSLPYVRSFVHSLHSFTRPPLSVVNVRSGFGQTVPD